LLDGTVDSGVVHRSAPPSPPPLLLPLLELEVVPLLLPLASPPPLLLPLLEPLLEPLASPPPLLEPVPPLGPLLLLQPWAKENEAATVRIEVVMRMRRSMVWTPRGTLDWWARTAAATAKTG
jgi:hypothetical protein